MIVADPMLTPLTNPVVLPIVTLPLPALHTPLPVSVTVIAEPVHTAVGPPIAAGSGLTTIVALPLIVRVQPVAVLLATTV